MRVKLGIPYLTNQIYGPVIELDVDFYQIIYNAKYALVNEKNLVAHMIGMKATYSMKNAENTKGIVEFYKLMNDLLITPNKSYYNATIGLAKFLLTKQISNAPNIGSALIYNSAQEHRTNSTVYNLAVTPEVFDRFFVLNEVQCQIMQLLPGGAANINTINHGIPDSQGNIVWQKNLNQMLKDVDLKFGNDCFYTDESQLKVISYPYGSGTIISKKKHTLVVDFKNYGKVEIPHPRCK